MSQSLQTKARSDVPNYLTTHTTIDKMIGTSMILILFGSIPVILLVTFWPPLSLALPQLLGVVR